MNGFELPFDIIVQIFFTSYVMKWAVSVLDTPFLYWAKRMKKSE
jgi:queuosine precursor transporter